MTKTIVHMCEDIFRVKVFLLVFSILRDKNTSKGTTGNLELNLRQIEPDMK
jgi:hypothetical protein